MIDTIEELRLHLKIDKHKLDDALETQAEIFHKISEHTALAIAEKDASKYDLDNLISATYLNIRKEAISKSRKITEVLLQNELEQVKEVQEAKEVYLEAKANTDEWLAFKESFSQRGYMLRDLATLWVAGYYAETAIKRSPAVDAVQQIDKRSQMAENRKPLRRKL